MNLVVNGHNIFVILLITFLTSLILVPIINKAAVHVSATEKLEDGSTKKDLPRLGGLAIYSAFLLGYMLYGEINTQMISVLIGSFLLILVGFIDDVKPVAPKYKLLVQIFAASIVVIFGELSFSEISVLGLKFYFGSAINSCLSILFIVVITNAINLIDGPDGLACGISSIYFLSIAVVAFILNRAGGLDTILSLIMLGSTLGFLIHNFPPAKIIMGDSGSLFLGFMISIIALLGYKVPTLTSLVVPVCILIVPIFDIICAIIRKIINGQDITKDKEYLHSRLLKMKYSPVVNTLIIYGVHLVFAALSIFYVLGNTKIVIFVYAVLMISLLFIVLKTDILFDHTKKKGKVTNGKNKR